MTRWDRGTLLVAAGAALLVGTLVVSAAAAPERNVGGGSEGSLLVGIQGGGTGWHEYGAVFEVRDGETVWSDDRAGSYFDATRLSADRVLVGFMESGYESGCAPYDPPCAKTGFRVLDPTAGDPPEIVDEYAFPVRTRKSSEVHAASRLPSGEYLLADMDRERVFTVRNDTVTWQWNASSFYEAPPDPTRRDWLHTNDVDAINATHYLVSIRNANQVLVLERGAGVVEVINEDDGGSDASCRRRAQLIDADGDGDVRCGDPDVLDHQHNPQWLGEGALLVADSDNDRVVELHRDAAAGEWEPVWTLERAGGVGLDWPRDADRLANGNTLVTDTLNRRIFEVRRNGSVVWSTSTERIPYEADRLPEGERVGASRYGESRTATPAATEGGDATPVARGTGGPVDRATGTAADGTDAVDAPDEGVPGLSLGLVVLRAVFPSTPFWFKELQLGLSLVALGLVAAGAVVRRRA